MEKKNYSKERYEENIRQKVSSFFRIETSDSRLKFVSITKVELSKDFSTVIIFWDTYNDHIRGDAKKAISGMAGRVRSHLSSVNKTPYTPQIRFEYDARHDSQEKITQILCNERQRTTNI